MSVRWMAHIWENGPRDGTQRAILLAIADHVGEGGSDAWPSISRLVNKTQFSESTVKRSINHLERDGWLERKPGIGRTTTIYRLNWIPKPPPERVPVDPSPEDLRGFTVNPQRVHGGPSEGSNTPAPLIVLTTNEPSGNQNPHTKTLSGEKANAPPPPENVPRGVAASPMVKPPPSGVRPMPPPNWRLSEGDKTLVDFVLMASPPGIVAGLTPGSITPVHRVLVITAVKREAQEHRVSYRESLDGLFAAVKKQSESVPLDRLNLFGGIEKYFNQAKYRKDPIHVQERKNGKFSGKGRSIENTLREFLGHSGDTGGVGIAGIEAGSGSRSNDAKTIHGRLG